MAYVPGVQVNANKAALALAEFDEFMKKLYAGAEEFVQRTPIDSSLTVDVERIKDGFKVAFKLASAELRLAESGEGRSPFMALERVLLKAKDLVKVWSINKKV